MELYFTDIFSESIRLRPSRWNGPVPTHFQSLGKNEIDSVSTPMMERMRWVKVINKWWTNWAEAETFVAATYAKTTLGTRRACQA